MEANMTSKLRVPLVQVPSMETPIQPSPGFAKKELADFKLDIMGACGFQCSYCSTPATTYHRVNKERHAQAAQEQTGQRLYHGRDPIQVVWPDVLEKLEAQVKQRARTAAGRGLPPWGTGKTLIFSMLTDGFSPILVGRGITEVALRLVLEHTGLRIRVLTKSAVVGAERWRRFFAAHPSRFVVGLSCGTLSDTWARSVEAGTSSPRARLRALRALQDAGVPTFGMLCPVFPDLLRSDGAPDIDALISAIRPDRCETVWAEPYNDRTNWKAVLSGYTPGSVGWTWLSDVYGGTDRGRGRMLWSRYATTLYERLRRRAHADGWLYKLRYLLYEDQITEPDAATFAGLSGVLLQSQAIAEGDQAGYSANPYLAKLQRSPEHGRIGASP
jgi:DNA repair photolyase